MLMYRGIEGSEIALKSHYHLTTISLPTNNEAATVTTIGDFADSNASDHRDGCFPSQRGKSSIGEGKLYHLSSEALLTVIGGIGDFYPTEASILKVPHPRCEGTGFKGRKCRLHGVKVWGLRVLGIISKGLGDTFSTPLRMLPNTLGRYLNIPIGSIGMRD